jgi:basic membrane protein A
MEQDAASSLFDGGAQVVMTGADTPPRPKLPPKANGVSPTTTPATAYIDACLTSMYWNWGPFTPASLKSSRAGTWVGGWEYFDADSGALGLYGFMEGETLQPGVAELPEEDLTR